MSRILRLILVTAFIVSAFVPAVPALAANAPDPEDNINCLKLIAGVGGTGEYGVQSSGATYCIAMPVNWNKNLVIFAHGYVDPTYQPDSISFPYEQLVLPDGTTTIPGLVTQMGFAFAVTSYSKKGLAVVQGVADVENLAALLKQKFGVRRVYLIGASEGGLVTTLAIEQNPGQVFNGGVATCGPVGDFQKQINYWGDFRTIYDFFFSSAVPISPDAVTIPATLYDQWRTYSTQTVGGFSVPVATLGPLQSAVEMAVALGALQPPAVSPTMHLFGVTNASFDTADPVNTMVATTLGILSYNVAATNDGIATLGGQPYFNTTTKYHDSSPINPVPDASLNGGVKRISSTGVSFSGYQTSGRLRAPLVTLHDTGDPIVPYWHEPLYLRKVIMNGSFFKFLSIPIFRYGHCNFTPAEALFSFYIMLIRSYLPYGPSNVSSIDEVLSILPQESDKQEFMQLMSEYGTTTPTQIFLPVVVH